MVVRLVEGCCTSNSIAPGEAWDWRKSYVTETSHWNPEGSTPSRQRLAHGCVSRLRWQLPASCDQYHGKRDGLFISDQSSTGTPACVSRQVDNVLTTSIRKTGYQAHLAFVATHPADVPKWMSMQPPVRGGAPAIIDYAASGSVLRHYIRVPLWCKLHRPRRTKGTVAAHQTFAAVIASRHPAGAMFAISGVWKNNQYRSTCQTRKPSSI
jgi:hypothetical protein